jgi:hypothetical protein
MRLLCLPVYLALVVPYALVAMPITVTAEELARPFFERSLWWSRDLEQRLNRFGRWVTGGVEGV